MCSQSINQIFALFLGKHPYMARRSNSRTFLSGSPDLGVPIRRYALFGFIALAFFLILWGQIAPESQARARSAILSVVAPFVDLVTGPLGFLRETSEGVRSYADLQTEVIELRRINNDLIQWESAYRAIKAENERLKRSLNFMEAFNLSYKTTRIVSDPGSAYARSLLIEGGRLQGFRAGDAVVGQRGLLGRIVETGTAYSRVMLITDINARVPVYIEEVQRSALVAGNNSSTLNVRFLNQTIQRSLEPGMRLVTSGQGGLYPPNIPVGLIAKVDAQGVTVLPSMQLQRLVEVQVISSTRPAPTPELQ